MGEHAGYVGVVLGAGYGTRLQRDIEQDQSGEFDSLKGVPKPLLPVGGKPLIDHWVDAFLASPLGIKTVYVVTNETFFGQFKAWAASKGFPESCVVNDGSTNNDNRLGACADIEFLLRAKREEIGKRDVVVVAGDTLFHDDFDLTRFLTALPPAHNGVSFYNLSDPQEVSKRGILEVDEQSHRVTKFLEKPTPEETQSRKACPAFYVYRNGTLPMLSQFLEEKKDAPLAERDAPGRLVGWLVEKADAGVGVGVCAGQVSGRYDIGGLESYKVALAHFANKA